MAAAEAKSSGGMLSRLSEKEKIQLTVWAMFMCVMLSIAAVIFFNRQMEEIDQDTGRYEAALDYLATAAPAFAERNKATGAQGTHKNVDDEALRKNDIKLTSFVAQLAEKAKLEVSSYDESELPFGNTKDGGPIVVEKSLRVNIREAPMTALIDLLERVHKAPEPVFVKRLDIRGKRKKPGIVRATVTVSTYLKKEEGE